MRRREAMFSLLGAAGALGAAEKEAQGAQGLAEDTVRQMLRTLAHLDPLPNEEAHLRAFLLSFRQTLPALPGMEPAITFDPEMEP